MSVPTSHSGSAKSPNLSPALTENSSPRGEAGPGIPTVAHGQESLATTPCYPKPPDGALSPLASPFVGSRDHFLERRFHDVGQLDLYQLSHDGVLAVLGKTHHVDELYRVPEGSAIEAGTYRIRDEGTKIPFITLKRHGDGRGAFSITIDVVDPDQALLSQIRAHGRLVGVIEKDRKTYKSRSEALPNCLIHQDSVNGLGNFFDLKADSPAAMERFVSELGLLPEHEVAGNYFQLKETRGISPTHLKVWQFHRRFEDYVQGIVSGTLTPLGFLTATAAFGGTPEAMVLSLVVAGAADGLSDAVGVSQTVQSRSNATFAEQASLFFKTMAGKAIIPMTFIPIVLSTNSALTTIVTAGSWAATLLGGTAAIQALAHERNLKAEVAKLIGYGAAAVGLGVAVGRGVPLLWEMLH